MLRFFMSESKTSWFSSLRAPNALVPFAGLLFLALILIFYILVFAVFTGSIPFFAFIWIPFIIVYLTAAFGILRQTRWGYITAVAVSAVSLLVYSDGGHGVEVFATPANAFEFVLVITFLPALFATFLYSISGLRTIWRKASIPRPSPPTIPRSNLLAVLTIGVIIGGLMVGLLAGATQSRLLSNSGASANVIIWQGAGAEGNGQYYVPSVFNITVGGTVTWYNRDTTVHTVTSTTGAFDSGTMMTGNAYTHTFNQAGTYDYTCQYHSWMHGTINVKP